MNTTHISEVLDHHLMQWLNISNGLLMLETKRVQKESKIKTGKYRHYKGNCYEVLGLAHSTETREKMVIYRGLYDSPDLLDEYGPDPWFARPYDMFVETIEYEGRTVPRFEFIGPM